MDKPEPQVTMATGHRAKANKTKNTIHLKRCATRTQKKINGSESRCSRRERRPCFSLIIDTK